MRKVMQTVRGLLRGQRGITGLETAIVLIAFVVVSSVFAFAVLSTGLLSSEKSKETVLGGLEEASATLVLKGAVIGRSNTTSTANTLVNSAEFQVSLAAGSGEPVEMTSTAVIITYIDEDQAVNVPSTNWQATWLTGSGDVINPDERVEIVVQLSGTSTLPAAVPILNPVLGTSKKFTIQVKPSVGATLIVEKTTPAELSPVINMQ